RPLGREGAHQHDAGVVGAQAVLGLQPRLAAARRGLGTGAGDRHPRLEAQARGAGETVGDAGEPALLTLGQSGPARVVGVHALSSPASPCPQTERNAMSLDGAYDPDNSFARIIRGEIPSVKVFEDERVLAFMDVYPQSEGHVLVISKASTARNLLECEPEVVA